MTEDHVIHAVVGAVTLVTGGGWLWSGIRAVVTGRANWIAKQMMVSKSGAMNINIVSVFLVVGGVGFTLLGLDFLLDLRSAMLSFVGLAVLFLGCALIFGRELYVRQQRNAKVG